MYCNLAAMVILDAIHAVFFPIYSIHSYHSIMCIQSRFAHEMRLLTTACVLLAVIIKTCTLLLQRLPIGIDLKFSDSIN